MPEFYFVMGNLKLRGKDLKKINYTSDRSRSLAVDILSRYFKHSSREEQIELLKKVKDRPDEYSDHEILGKLAEEFIELPDLKPKEEIKLLRESGALKVFGKKLISSNALRQMEVAMSLPVSVKGALMPDAHQGYGLPVGGVLAVRNAVIPYGVGLDIGCRMSLSIFDLKPDYLQRHSYRFKSALKERTCFGTGGELTIQQEHEVLDRKEFGQIDLLRKLHGKAARQLGSSGSGNHFVEFGIVEFSGDENLGIPAGEYVGLLAHSGSRGMGASIASFYTDLAMQYCLLPKHAKNLAWLDLNTEAGQEYWIAMNLAGDYAKACHDQIHYHISKYLGLKAVVTVENHHNFAWKERQPDGEELIVHRKGATPAKAGCLGIIPGSMTAPGYIVQGKGGDGSLDSASHGAGRKMSRGKAKQSVTGSALKKMLSKERVTLIGGGPDEAPVAYKDLDEVMQCQKDLVEVIGKFHPKIVRMNKG